MPGHSVHGVSGMPSNQLIHGRPYGGCAIAFKRSLNAKVTPLATINSDRMCGVSVDIDINFLLFCIYMPCDDASNADTYREILDGIAVTHALLSPSAGTIGIIGGDFNTDFARNLPTPSSCANSCQIIRLYVLFCMHVLMFHL